MTSGWRGEGCGRVVGRVVGGLREGCGWWGCGWGFAASSDDVKDLTISFTSASLQLNYEDKNSNGEATRRSYGSKVWS